MVTAFLVYICLNLAATLLVRLGSILFLFIGLFANMAKFLRKKYFCKNHHGRIAAQSDLMI